MTAGPGETGGVPYGLRNSGNRPPGNHRPRRPGDRRGAAFSLRNNLLAVPHGARSAGAVPKRLVLGMAMDWRGASAKIGWWILVGIVGWYWLLVANRDGQGDGTDKRVHLSAYQVIKDHSNQFAIKIDVLLVRVLLGSQKATLSNHRTFNGRMIRIQREGVDFSKSTYLNTKIHIEYEHSPNQGERILQPPSKSCWDMLGYLGSWQSNLSMWPRWHGNTVLDTTVCFAGNCKDLIYEIEWIA